jgi:hypothetical protein
MGIREPLSPVKHPRLWHVHSAFKMERFVKLFNLHDGLEELPNIKQRTEKWNNARALRLTASDTSKVLGFSNPWNLTAADVIASKTSDEPEPITAAQQRGIDNEPRIIQEYIESPHAKRLGIVSCHSTGCFVDRQEPWLLASPDAIARCSDGSIHLVEVKSYAQDPGEILPQHVYSQASSHVDKPAVAM